MTNQLISFIIIALGGVLVIFSFAIGIEKMIRVILGNYILSSICLAATQSLALLVDFLNKTPDLKFAGISYDALGRFLLNGNTTIVLIIYITLLVVIYRTSKIHITLPSDDALKKMLHLIFVPLTVISIILTLQIALLGLNGLNVATL